MAALRSDRSSRPVVLPRAALIGLAMGVVATAGGSLMLYEAGGLLSAAAGLTCTLLFSLLVGVWAGAPGASEEELPLRGRWAAAAVATALAGAFATGWSLMGGVAGPVQRVLGLLALIAAPVYALGMLLPVLLAWGERWEELQEDGAEGGYGAENGWGVLGTVTGGVLAGLGLGVLLSGLVLVPLLGPGPLVLALSLSLLLPVLFAEPQESPSHEALLHQVETPFGVLRVTERHYPGERQPERRLYLDEEQESGELVRSGAPALAYIAAAESWLGSTTPPGSSYLFLGGGAYTLPRRVAERDPRAHITVVELDPEITRLAYRFFGLRREHGIASVHGDARAFLEQRGEAEYDRIYLDVYGGREALPYPLVTREAFAAALRWLRPGGVAALNLIGVTAGPESLRMWSVVRTAQDVFPGVALYTHLGPDFPERQNLLLVLSAEPGHAFPARAGLFERWPREQWPEVAAATVFRDLLPRPAAPPLQGTADREPVTGNR